MILTDEQAEQYVSDRRAQRDPEGRSGRFDEELKKVLKVVGSTSLTVAFGPKAIQSLRGSDDSDPSHSVTLTPAAPAVTSSSASKRASRPNLLEQMKENLDLSALLTAEPSVDIHNRNWRDVGPSQGWDQTVEDVARMTGDWDWHQPPHHLNVKISRDCLSDEWDHWRYKRINLDRLKDIFPFATKWGILPVDTHPSAIFGLREFQYQTWSIFLQLKDLRKVGYRLKSKAWKQNRRLEDFTEKEVAITNYQDVSHQNIIALRHKGCEINQPRKPKRSKEQTPSMIDLGVYLAADCAMDVEYRTGIKLAYSSFMSCLLHDHDSAPRTGEKLRREYLVLTPDH